MDAIPHVAREGAPWDRPCRNEVPELVTDTQPRDTLRPARPEDLAALVAIEQACFSGDRISRRSFRRFLDSPGAVLIVAEAAGGLRGYALLLFRAGTALARLYSLSVDPGARGAGLAARLLAAAERAAFDRDRIVLRLELREDNEAARRLYLGAGYRPLGRVPEYYEDGTAALRMEKRLHGEGLPVSRVPYYPQTTDFSCGPACLLMALAHFDKHLVADEALELRLWRETTMIYLAAGHGGCGPYGLGVAGAKRGLGVEVRLSPPGPLFISSVRDPAKRRVMEIVQEDYRREAAELGVVSSNDPLPARGLAEEIAGGALAIVLISESRMMGRKGPHWVLVHNQDDRHLFIHDPWLGYGGMETPADAANLPIPDREFERMARWGRMAVRAQVIFRKA